MVDRRKAERLRRLARDHARDAKFAIFRAQDAASELASELHPRARQFLQDARDSIEAFDRATDPEACEPEPSAFVVVETLDQAAAVIGRCVVEIERPGVVLPWISMVAWKTATACGLDSQGRPWLGLGHTEERIAVIGELGSEGGNPTPFLVVLLPCRLRLTPDAKSRSPK
jgi:hypothetical protein